MGDIFNRGPLDLTQDLRMAPPTEHGVQGIQHHKGKERCQDEAWLEGSTGNINLVNGLMMVEWWLMMVNDG